MTSAVQVPAHRWCGYIDGSIDTVDLADDAVDSTKLWTKQTADKIAPDAVNSSKILDGSINDTSQPIQLQ